MKIVQGKIADIQATSAGGIIPVTGCKENVSGAFSQSGAVPFTRPEIEVMQGIPRALMDKIIDVKEIFLGAEVISSDDKVGFPPPNTFPPVD